MQKHFNDARAYHRLPPEARDHYNSTHALYRTWGKHSPKDHGLIVLAKLGKPSDYINAADFHAQRDHVEASWIDIAKSNSPRGFNVCGISSTKRRRNRATAQLRRLRRLHASGRLHTAPPTSDDDSSQEGSVSMHASSNLVSDDDSAAPPLPPLSPHVDMLTEIEAESDASSDHGQAEENDSASHTAYARRAFVHLIACHLLILRFAQAFENYRRSVDLI